MKKANAMFMSVLAALVLAAAIGPASAAGNEVAYNQVGVRFFDRQKVLAGEMYAAPNGQQVPSSITYTDAAGGKTNYLSIRQIAEILDADIRWDSATGTVEIAGSPKADLSDIAITTPSDWAEDDAAQVREFGQTAGPFEEIDPKTIETLITETPSPEFHMKDAHIQYGIVSIPPIMKTIEPERGTYLVYTVTNNGTYDAVSSVFRKPVVSYPKVESFPEVTVAPGETLVRAFKVAEDANPLNYDIYFDFRIDFFPGRISDWPDTDMTVSLAQYP